MWKKPDDAVPPLGSKLGEQLVGEYLDSLSEKGKSAVGPQRVVAEVQHQPSTPATMAAYTTSSPRTLLHSLDTFRFFTRLGMRMSKL